MRTTTARSAAALAVAVAVPLATLAVTSAPAAAASYERTTPTAESVPGEFLVSFQRGVSEANRKAAVESKGGKIVKQLPALGSTLVHFATSQDKARANAKELKADKRVASVEANLVYRTTQTPNDPAYAQQWAFPKISAPQAWDTQLGNSSVVIAVIDTGVERTHPDLDAKIVPGYDFVQGDTAPDDGNGHGTHVAGTAAAESWNSSGGAGTCPGCRIMPIRVLDNNGSGSLVNVANGIRYAADHGAQVINMSLGGGGSTTLQSAVDYAAGKGVFLSCAAGNDNTSSTSSAYPGAYASCFAVASTTSTDARSSFSNYGSWVEAAAPGSNIYSTWLNGGYNTISGTSMATPHVAGLAGMLASQGLTSAQIRDRICASADKITGTGSSWTCGRINAYAAVTGTTPTPPPPPPPGSTSLVNGGFESGISPWVQSSSGGYSLRDSSRPHTGTWGTWLGGYNSGTDSLQQTVTVPSNGTLTYWWYLTTQESSSYAYDLLRVRVLSSSGAVLATPRTWTNASGAGLWRQDTLSLASYAGQSVRIEFLATTDSSLLSSFFVDDVALA
jgi:subtilisin family serine protease